MECCETTEVHEELLEIVNEKMPPEETLYNLAELYKVFGDSTRIRILFVLFEAEVCVRPCAGAFYDAVRYFTSAPHSEAE